MSSAPLSPGGITVLITGANQGVGYEACKQMSDDSRISKVILTCRSSAKAETAISSLMQETNKPREFFDYAVLDLGDIETIDAAIASLPTLDRVCLNAGVVSHGLHKESGVNNNFVSTLGHAKLVEGLIAAGKIGSGSRVIYIGSELTRSMYGMTGVQPCLWSFTEKDIDPAMHDDVPCNCFPVRSQIDNYGRSKIVGTLWTTDMARRHPNIYFATTSPGAVVTNIFDGAFFPINQIAAVKCGSCSLAECLFIGAGIAHSKQAAGARYKSALLDDDFTTKFKTGSVPLSGKCLGCLPYAGRGPLYDNTSYAAYFSDAAALSAAGTKVTAEISRWEQEHMQR